MMSIARLTLATTLALSSLCVSAQDKKPDLAKGEASFSAVCAACHGADGNSGTPENPKLAQQHPKYLVKQLQEFKSGKRNSAIMSGFASTLSDEDMVNVAYWLASKTAKPGFAKEKELVALTSCASSRRHRRARNRRVCRLPPAPAAPGLSRATSSGQHADTRRCSRRVRDGVQLNSVPMARVAARLNGREIRAVADYIAGLH